MIRPLAFPHVSSFPTFPSGRPPVCSDPPLCRSPSRFYCKFRFFDLPKLPLPQFHFCPVSVLSFPVRFSTSISRGSLHWKQSCAEWSHPPVFLTYVSSIFLAGVSQPYTPLLNFFFHNVWTSRLFAQRLSESAPCLPRCLLPSRIPFLNMLRTHPRRGSAEGRGT